MDPVWILFGIFVCIVIWAVWSCFDTTVRKNECKCCGHRGHKAEQCFHRNRICEICHEGGHIASVCTKIFEAENSQFKPSIVLWALTWIDYICTSSDNRTSRCKSCGERAHGTCQYAVRRCFRCRVKGHKSSACPGKKLYREIVPVVKTGAIVAAVVLFFYLQK
ncbi:zinc finger CCHC domain-containing protein 13 [Culex quinquefasciatus]|uniref:zinc finger CCHC domain-containing protein 13 n=1 Tax=Culex quinquefasciatus TaxID=7176 RepID=UPI0018E36185|nr:zinc finger CCHC domain-containing protein 13 [Culex quinquefasciatus]